MHTQKKKGQIFHYNLTTWNGNTCNRTKNITWRKKVTKLTQSSSHKAHCALVPGDMGRHAHRYWTDTLESLVSLVVESWIICSLHISWIYSLGSWFVKQACQTVLCFSPMHTDMGPILWTWSLEPKLKCTQIWHRYLLIVLSSILDILLAVDLSNQPDCVMPLSKLPTLFIVTCPIHWSPLPLFTGQPS